MSLHDRAALKRGVYLNPGNRGFAEIVQIDYVDKTGLIGLIKRTIGTKKIQTNPNKVKNCAIIGFNLIFYIFFSIFEKITKKLCEMERRIFHDYSKCSRKITRLPKFVISFAALPGLTLRITPQIPHRREILKSTGHGRPGFD